jgi:hypothetical protein
VPLAWAAIRRGDGIARQLAAGCVLTLGSMFVLLAYQGHGWGYRYIHGLLGNFALLAGYGWLQAIQRGDNLAQGRKGLAIATLVTVTVMLPWQLRHAVSFMEPYRAAVDQIKGMPADIVLVDARGMQFGGDLVRNEPDLTNSPKILDYASLSRDQVSELCRKYTVKTFDLSDAVQLGIKSDLGRESSRAEQPAPLPEMLRQPRCR